MTKTELVSAMAKLTGMTQKQAAAALDAFIKTVEEAVAKGDEVRIPGFGVFEVKDRSARKGRNPQTGEEIEIPARKTVVFRTGSELKLAAQSQ